MKKSSNATIALQVGCTRESVSKWLHEAGLTPESPGAVELCQQKHKKREEPDPNQIDPCSGLTWYKLEQKEKALKLARENRIAERLENETYMKVEDHFQIIGIIAERLNLLPLRAKSELGLSEPQAIRLQHLIDEARSVTAKEIKNEAIEENPK